MKLKFRKDDDWRRVFLCEHVYSMDWQFVFVNGMSEFDEKEEVVAKNVDWGGEEVLLIYDESLFGKGAAGFVLTNYAIYSIEENKRMLYKDITNVELGDREFIISTDEETFTFGCKRLTGQSTIEAILCVIRESAEEAK